VSLVKTELGAGRRAAWREPGATTAVNAGRVYELVLAGERRLGVPAGFDVGEVAVLVALLEDRGC
jgi:hypothetical protein